MSSDQARSVGSPVACGGQPSVTRRDFRRWAGLAAAGARVGHWPAIAGPFDAADFDWLIPADKKLDPGWVRSLYARGEPTVYRGAELEKMGMPIGGLCAGQLYLGGDGRLWHWDIFNLPQPSHFTDTGGPNYAHPPTPSSPIAQGFGCKVTVDGRTHTRTLDSRGIAPQQITFCGQYPVARVEYRDPAFPLNVSLEAFSPFIPLNVAGSSLPATVLRFTVRNLNGDGTQGRLSSPSFKIERRCIAFLIGGGAHADRTCLNLWVRGERVRTATGRGEERLEWQEREVSEFEGDLVTLATDPVGGDDRRSRRRSGGDFDLKPRFTRPRKKAMKPLRSSEATGPTRGPCKRHPDPVVDRHGRCSSGLSVALAAVVGLSALPWGWAADTALITTASLMDEMTDLAGLAEFPTPSYTCKQFSSYDRKSKSPQDQTTEGWFANADAGHYLQVEERAGRKEYVMMEAAGPGAIVRVWSANPAGTLRVYLDGAEEPVLEAAMTDLLGGQFPGLPKPMGGEYSKGWNLYFPIPYARSCRVTSDKGGFYYHVNYRTYDAGTRVESFNLAQLPALAPRVQKLVARLNEPRGQTEPSAARVEPFDLEVPAGGSLRQEFVGPQAFTRAVVRAAAPDLEAALRGLVVQVTFDGEECIQAPLGDFFGSAPGLNRFSTLPLGLSADGALYCHWFMPFRESATIELQNHTAQAVALAGELAVQSYTWTPSSMHFHAKWRAQSEVPTRPMIDWNYLTAQGRGVFVGVSFAIDNPVKDWWGEGDEKIYVDGEAFPSHFGTGTEDYYGYAWCWPGLFTHAYHAQPRCDGPGNFGRTSVNRFHILDRIPFTREFKFDMELWHWHQTCKVNLAVTAYWYARPGATDTFRPIRADEAVVHPLPPYRPPRVAGAIEGETMKILKVRGTAEPQDWGGLSNESHLWWHAGMQPGDVLTVAFAAPKTGKYRVFGRFLKASDYGIHQLAINGQSTGAPMDFYAAEVRPTSEQFLGEFELKSGDNQLSVTVTGANEKAVKAYMFGLDYLLLKPAD